MTAPQRKQERDDAFPTRPSFSTMIDFDRPPRIFKARCLDGPLCGRVLSKPNPTFTVWRDSVLDDRRKIAAGEYRFSEPHGSWLWTAAP